MVIVGYSFPPTDTRGLELFRGALAARNGEISIEFVAPAVADIVARIGEKELSKAKTVTPFNMKFEDYLEKILIPDAPNRMKKAADESEEVRKWLELVYALNQAAFQ